MTKRTTLVRKVKINERDLPSFLDMLRYDGCTVVSWERADATIFEVTLRSAPGRTRGFEFTDARWASFGLTLTEVD